MAQKKPVEKKNIPSTQLNPKKATGLRVGAWILWLLAIACEVFGILLIRKTIYLSPEQFGLDLTYADFMLYAIIAVLVLDLILVLIGSKLWKDANHYDPVKKSDSGAKKFFQNQMGLIIAIIAFAPILILLLTDKDTFASGKNKKVVSIVAIVALVLAVLLSVDFNAPVAEEYDTRAQELGAELSDTVFWTRFGNSYHLHDNAEGGADGGRCQSLTRTVDENLFSGTLEEAFAAGRYDPCDHCAGGGEK